jgi:hypothetical protein
MTSNPPTSPANVAPPEASVESSAPASASLLHWIVGISGALALVVGGFLLIWSLGWRRT